MKVLMLENLGGVSFQLKKFLENLGHIVLDAFNVNDADSLLEENEVDCLIVDLNMPPEGLTAGQIKLTEEGLFTGWIWLSECVFPIDPELTKRTIILTDYGRQLTDLVGEGYLGAMGIKLVPKREFSGVATLLKKYLSAIERTTY